MTRKEILTGIAAYHNEQAEIIEVIKTSGGSLHQDKFDNAFGSVRRRLSTPEEYKNHGCKYTDEFCAPKIWPLDLNAFILGDCTFSEWSKYIELTQLMVAAGLLKQSGKKGKIKYSLP